MIEYLIYLGLIIFGIAVGLGLGMLYLRWKFNKIQSALIDLVDAEGFVKK
jgi:hypothetical protein